MKMIKLIFLNMLFLMLFACNRNEKKVEIKQIITELKGKEVHFHDNYSCNFFGLDTTMQPCLDLFQKEYKILLYVDSSGCSDCRLRLYEWKRLIAEADILFHDKLGFLFFFQPKNKKEVIYLLKKDSFDYPVFIDTDNTIEQLNHFPAKDTYRCFLLDKDNKILLIGNPVLNPKIWELYKQTVAGKKAQ